MSDNNTDLEQRLAALEQGKPRHGVAAKRRSPLLALLLAGLILAGGLVLFLFSGSGEEVSLPTATPDEFQTEGDGFGEIEPFVPPPAPEPEIVLVEPDPVEPNAELSGAARRPAGADRGAARTRRTPDAGADSAAAEAIDALTRHGSRPCRTASEKRSGTQFQAELAKPGTGSCSSCVWTWTSRGWRPTQPAPCPARTLPRKSCARGRPSGWRREEEARRHGGTATPGSRRSAPSRNGGSPPPTIAFGGTGGANAGETELDRAQLRRGDGFRAERCACRAPSPKPRSSPTPRTPSSRAR